MGASIYASAPTASAQGIGLSVSAPTDSAVVQGNAVTVSFQATGVRLVPTTVPLDEAGKRPELNRPGEGHVHFVLDVLPLVVWERGEPYRFANVPAGQHQLMVEVVENDHSSFSPPVMRMIRFRTEGGVAAVASSGSPPLPRGGEGPLFPGRYDVALVFGGAAIAGGLLLRRRP